MYLHGYNPQGVEKRPEWVSADLHYWYWVLRVEKPKGARRRLFYRKIEREKIRIAELGVDQELIKATCRYLSCYSVVAGNKMLELMGRPVIQLSFDFSVSNQKNLSI